MKMEAIVCTKYGPPEVLKLKEVAKPSPRDNEVLVKVHAASVNAADLEILNGAWSARIIGPFKPRNKIPGTDVAGRVEAVGRNVKKFQPGQKVLINGAGGGMGTFAVQIAKSFGAEVTGVDSARKLDMLRSIGADQVIDYTQEDFTKSGQRYDLILDVAAYHSIFAYKRALGPKGIYVMLGGSRAAIFQAVFPGPLISMTGSKKMGINTWNPNKKEDLAILQELFEAGKVVPVIDRRYPLNEVPDALRYLEEGHAKGKLVIIMDDNNKT